MHLEPPINGAALHEQPLRPPNDRRACATCIHSAVTVVGAPLQCRRNPPVVTIVKMKTAGLPPGLDLGMQQPDEMLQALTNFPSVQPDEWCGEYEPGVRPTAIDN